MVFTSPGITLFIKFTLVSVVLLTLCHTFVGPNTLSDNETITKYEIMDGLPVRGESKDPSIFFL